MEDLYEAIGIFLKYSKDRNPTNCVHDEMQVNVDPSIVSKEDLKRLDELGFVPGDDDFKSYRFGSC